MGAHTSDIEVFGHKLVKSPREAGYFFVTCPTLPGFTVMQHPGEDDQVLREHFAYFVGFHAALTAATSTPPTE